MLGLAESSDRLGGRIELGVRMMVCWWVCPIFEWVAIGLSPANGILLGVPPGL